MKKTLSILAVATFALFTLNSCSKDDAPGGTYKIQYKLIGSEGVKIGAVAFSTDGIGQMESITNVGKQTFESEVYTISNEGYPTITASATGPSNNSTLKAQIFKDGELFRESTSTGTILAVGVNGIE